MDDLISRQMAIHALGEDPEVWTDDDEYSKGMLAQWQYDKRAIESLSSVSEQKTGEWMYEGLTESVDRRYRCSNCDFTTDDSFMGPVHNFCPNCGAKMEVNDGKIY